MRLLMMRSVVLVSFIAHRVVSQREPPCSVCGDGLEVGAPDTIFVFPGQPAVACGRLEQAGADGFVAVSTCVQLPAVIGDTCQCQPIQTGPTLTPVSIAPAVPGTLTPAILAPVLQPGPITMPPVFGNPNNPPVTVPTPTLAPSILSIAPSNDGCSICGDQFNVGAPDVILVFPGQPIILCGVLELAGFQGLIPGATCGQIPGVIFDDCKCRPKSPERSCICGEGFELGVPEVIPVECGILELAGEQGQIPQSVCDQLRVLIFNDCECQTLLPSTSPSLSPSMGASAAPSIIPSASKVPSTSPNPSEVPSKTPSSSRVPSASASPSKSMAPSLSNAPSALPCSICGDGFAVRSPDIPFMFFQPTLTCGQLEAAGQDGQLSREMCAQLPRLTREVCRCASIVPSSTPSTVPTFSPSTSISPSLSYSPSAPPSTSAPTSTPSSFCSVCGDGLEVGAPGVIFLAFPGQPPISCELLEQAGRDGLIPVDSCVQLPAIIDTTCQCQSMVTGPTLTPITLAPGFPEPTPRTLTPATPAMGIEPISASCSVCGDGFAVGSPDAIFELPAFPWRTCSQWEAAGESGTFPPDACDLLTTFLRDICNCISVVPSSIPSMLPNFPPSTSITPSSSRSPSPAPSATPSDLSCSVCGEGLEVGAPDVILFIFPNGEQIPCGILEQAGQDGLVSADVCEQFPPVIGTTCECQVIQMDLTLPPTSITETTIPTPADGVTLAPTKAPPIITHAPTVRETDFPSTPEEAGGPTSVEGMGMGSFGMPKSDKRKSKGKDPKTLRGR